MAKDIDLSDLLTNRQEQQGAEAKAIVPEKVEREVETAVDTLTPEDLAKVEQIKDSIQNKLRTQFACETTDATPEQIYVRRARAEEDCGVLRQRPRAGAHEGQRRGRPIAR